MTRHSTDDYFIIYGDTDCQSSFTLYIFIEIPFIDILKPYTIVTFLTTDSQVYGKIIFILKFSCNHRVSPLPPYFYRIARSRISSQD